jgi:hypothetical protein
MKNNNESKNLKKTSPFVADPFNNRSGKSGKGAVAVATSAGVKSPAKVSGPKRKGGSGGDR